MTEFTVDPVIASLTHQIADWPLSRVFVYNDSRYQWGLLVPRRPGVIEMCDLSADDQRQLMAEIVDALLASRHQPPFRPHQQSSDEQCCQHRGTHPPAARHAGRFDYVELVAQREAPNGQRYRQVEAEQQPDAGIFGEQGDHAFDDDVGLAPGQANDVEWPWQMLEQEQRDH